MKQQRRCEGYMRAVYERGFNMRQPYQFLVDGDFCRSSLQHKFEPKERLPQVLGGACRLFVTNCVMHLLRQAARTSQDPLITNAPFAARRLELRRCRHDEPLDAAACLLDLIGTHNPFHYGVASDSDDLKQQVRQIAGVPIIYLERGTPLLEAPTTLTMRVMQERERAKRSVTPLEATLINKTLGEISKPEILSKHKRRRAKGPNPLSVKKSSKSKAAAAQDSATAKRRRRRKRSSSASGGENAGTEDERA